MVGMFWAVTTGLLTFAMLLVGGVPVLQNATIIMGLPFSAVFLLVMLGLYTALRVEQSLTDSYRASLPGLLSGRSGDPSRTRNWRQRRTRALRYPDQRQTQRFVSTGSLPALQEVTQELRTQGDDVTLHEGVVDGPQLPHLDLVVSMSDERAFKYQIYPVQLGTPTYAVRTESERVKYYRMEILSLEGSHGYDLMGYSKEQVITDVLDHYETHLDFLHLNRTEPGNIALPVDQMSKDNWEADYDSEEGEK